MEQRIKRGNSKGVKIPVEEVDWLEKLLREVLV
jgi:hypothetical protein